MKRSLATVSLAVVSLGTIARADQAPKTADKIVIEKSAHTLKLMRKGELIKSYGVALGQPVGKKQRAGDRLTPEGSYFIDRKNPKSTFHLALHISYPNEQDRERARKLGVRPGGDVEIHGLESRWAWLGSWHRKVDWTEGCVAVTNNEIEEIWRLVPVGTPVEIDP
jgi:murein L,D-transpeptidase YafK